MGVEGYARLDKRGRARCTTNQFGCLHHLSDSDIDGNLTIVSYLISAVYLEILFRWYLISRETILINNLAEFSFIRRCLKDGFSEASGEKPGFQLWPII
ncbi:hypothetical protein V6N13_120614 [Hibiscus sabdariffa]